MKDDKKVIASEKKINKVFEKMKHKGISVSGRKIDNDTYDRTYPDVIKSLYQEARKEFGIVGIEELDEGMLRGLVGNRVKKYHQNGDTKQSSNINSILSAVKSFNFGIKETNVFKNDKKFSLGDTDAIRKELKDVNIRRRARHSNTLRANPAQCEKVIENIKEQGRKTRTREIAYHIAKICYLTGARVTAALNLKARDIDVEGNKITFFKDKGGLTRTVEIDKDTSDYLRTLKKGRKDDQNIFLYQRKDGTKKSVEEVRKAVSDIVKSAGAEFSRVDREQIRDEKGNIKYIDVKKDFKTHSFRKGFCVKRTHEYLKKFENPEEMKKYIEKRVAEEPKLQGKIKNLYERINKSLLDPRGIKPSEFAIFFTSVDVGHFRNDVMTSYYTTYKEVKKYYDEKGK